MNLEKLCRAAVEIARETGRFIAEERKKFSLSNVVSKGERDLVSYVDVTAEKMIVNDLQKILPEAGFLTEEKTIAETGSSLTWIVDPLDGTTNFVHGVPAYSVSIALALDQQLLIGIVYEINLQECFYAWQGGGAFLNGEKVSVTKTGLLRDALIATGFPYKEFPQMDRFFTTLRYLFNNTHGVRRLGSAAVDLAYVACGRFDGFFEYNLNPWDVAGGALIVKEAGGIVSDFRREENFLFGKEIIATNPAIYNELLNTILKPGE